MRRLPALALVTSLLIVLIESQSQCDSSFPDQTISHILSSNRSSSPAYYLGNTRNTTLIASAAECKNYCLDPNYICDAQKKHSYSHLEESTNASSVTSDATQCRLTLENNQPVWGSWLLLTPGIVADEYMIELNMRIMSGGSAGIVFAASQSQAPLVYASIDLRRSVAYVGWFWSNNSNADEWVTIYNIDIEPDTDYTLKVHKLPDGHFHFYLDGVWIWSSSEEGQRITSSAFPLHYAGFYAYASTARANLLRVSFPSSAQESVCRAYAFNTNTAECYGYYGVDYAALYDSLSTNPSYDSGILSPTCQPTNSPTNVPTQTTASPTKSPTKSPTANPTIAPTGLPTDSPTVLPTKTPTATTSTTTTTTDSSMNPGAQSPFVSPTSAPTDAPVVIDDGEGGGANSGGDGGLDASSGTFTLDDTEVWVLLVFLGFMSVWVVLACALLCYCRKVNNNKKQEEAVVVVAVVNAQERNANQDAIAARKKPNASVGADVQLSVRTHNATNATNAIVHRREKSNDSIGSEIMNIPVTPFQLQAQQPVPPRVNIDSSNDQVTRDSAQYVDEEEDEDDGEELFEQYDEEQTEGNDQNQTNTTVTTRG